jgi:hypothetical protein
MLELPHLKAQIQLPMLETPSLGFTETMLDQRGTPGLQPTPLPCLTHEQNLGFRKAIPVALCRERLFSIQKVLLRALHFRLMAIREVPQSCYSQIPQINFKFKKYTASIPHIDHGTI